MRTNTFFVACAEVESVVSHTVSEKMTMGFRLDWIGLDWFGLDWFGLVWLYILAYSLV
jgi:hypothetical protein